MEKIQALLDLLTLEKKNDHTFIGENYKAPWKRVFGGQVLGQSLHAAYQTVPEDRFAHSMHGYFLLAGNIDIPITYDVDILRDGGSFTTRRVIAYQNGKAIFNMAASFQKRQVGFDHQISMPNVLPPEVLLPDFKQLELLKEKHPEEYKYLPDIPPRPIEFRPVERLNPGQEGEPHKHVWFKSNEKIDVDIPMQHQLLAYASDYNLLTTAVLPHRHEFKYGEVFFASLDHAMYFHRDFKMDDWLLYAIDSPSASGARGFSRGNIFNQDGELISSVVQEGLMRKRR